MICVALSNAKRIRTIAADVGETPLQETPAKVRRNVTLAGVETDLQPIPPDLRGDIKPRSLARIVLKCV